MKRAAATAGVLLACTTARAEIPEIVDGETLYLAVGGGLELSTARDGPTAVFASAQMGFWWLVAGAANLDVGYSFPKQSGIARLGIEVIFVVLGARAAFVQTMGRRPGSGFELGGSLHLPSPRDIGLGFTASVWVARQFFLVNADHHRAETVFGLRVVWVL